MNAPATPTPPAQDTLLLDPVALNIVNRIAEGTVLEGTLNFKGGLLLQGTLRGEGEIAGRLVIWHTGQLQGRFRILGDLIVLGHLGGVTDDTDPGTVVECQGTVQVASTGVCTGSLSAARLRLYDGGVLQGPFRTLRHERQLPVLDTMA
ncbi:polymer-forming cytoskeletal protein [Ideonella sp. B7]|uniref:bactofilin family protein n=1 Tax=Ideonella benzenivorans TaxID=2831643 RepID=UPI001CECED25|nr:polymer-forming cytoskeletal protein [Ideonella benzenivorans]MCA6216752.1 polymer-forming cytoskeletal protein [Ideonella benzenivorans]